VSDLLDPHHQSPLVALQVQRLPGRVHAGLVGELDMTNAAEVLRRLTELAADGELLDLDLSRLGFLDSAGIAALHRLHRALAGQDGPGDQAGPGERPGRLRVHAGPTTVAGRTLRLAGMDQVLLIEADDGAA
jgi:ABC-type transporter Mla MlaB component